MTLVVVVCVAAACSTGRSRQQAFDRVAEELLEPAGLGPEHVVIYGPTSPLHRGDTVAPVLALDGATPVPTEIDGDTWFFWVDLAPYAGFAHPTLFLYVDAETGELRAEGHEWFPVINGAEMLPLEDRSDPRWVFGDPVYPAPEPDVAAAIAPPTAVAESSGPARAADGLESVALLLTGWSSSSNTRKDLDRMSAELAARNYQVTRVIPDPLDDEFTLGLILRALDDLGGEREQPLRQVVIYYTGHGSDTVWVMGSEENSPIIISVAEIAERVQKIDALEVVIIMDSCRSGSIVDRFPEYYDESSGDTAVALYSATTWEQTSYAANGGVFTNLLLDKIRSFPTGQPLPMVTDGNLFQTERQGSRPLLDTVLLRFIEPWTLEFLGENFQPLRDTRQQPQWRYICPCASRGVTAPIRFNASFTDGSTGCGARTSFPALVIMDWSPSGELVLQKGEIGAERSGTMNVGDFTASGGSPAVSESYSGSLSCDCVGVGLYTLNDALDCTTQWTFELVKQPW